MKKLRERLLFKFAFIFTVFTLVATFLGSIMAYVSQTNSYRRAALGNLQCICDYLERMIQESNTDFITYQKYYMEHFSEAKIPFNFTEYQTAQRKYEKLLAEMDPKLLGDEKFDFNSFPEEVKMAYFIYIFMNIGFSLLRMPAKLLVFHTLIIWFPKKMFSTWST